MSSASSEAGDFEHVVMRGRVNQNSLDLSARGLTATPWLRCFVLLPLAAEVSWAEFFATDPLRTMRTVIHRAILLLLLAESPLTSGARLRAVPTNGAAARIVPRASLRLVEAAEDAPPSQIGALQLPRRGPRPELPELSEEDESVLAAGKFLQRQLLDKGSGSGFAVQEVRADVDEAWRCVADFAGYKDRIKTVRTAVAYTPEPDSLFGDLAPDECCYDFLVSRIRLPLAVRFTVSDAERYATWVLDRPSWVLAESTGFWHVQPVPTRPGYVRVWFCVAVRLRARVPGFVVGLVSRLGLRKACFWVRAALGDGQDGGDAPAAELATNEDA